MIIKHIRQTYQKRLVLPVVALIVLVLSMNRLSFREYLLPFEVESEAGLDIALAEGHGFISLSGLNLSYTGYDYLKNGNVEGHVYYSLQDGDCHFYIMDKDDNPVFQDTYSDYQFVGRIAFENELRDILTDALATELDWTQEGVKHITAPYMVSSVDLFPLNQIAYIALTLLIAAAIILDLVRTSFLTLFPGQISGLKPLRRRKNLKTQLVEIEKELAESYTSDNVYLTETHLIFLRGIHTAVIPIADIHWIYIQNQLHRLPLREPSMSAILHIITKSKASFHCNLGESNEYKTIKAHLINRNPDIICGYNKANKKRFSKQTTD